MTSWSDGKAEDALKVLGRVADAFDNPTLHKPDKELLFVVNVVKSRRLLTSLSSEESVCHDATCVYDSSSDSIYDEDVEVIELGDVSRWEHARSYPYAPRRSSHEPRSVSFRQDDGMYDVTKMLLTSSPLDRLDRLARMELKKTEWVERADKWTVVEMGLQGVSLPVTPSKHAGLGVGENTPPKTTSPVREKQTPRTPRRAANGEQLSIHGGYNKDTRERDQRQGDGIKTSTPTSIRSPGQSQESDSYLVDFLPGSYTRGSYGASRRSHPVAPQSAQVQTRGRLGQVVRNFVKRMLPPSGSHYSRTRQYKGDSPSSEGATSPRSNVSGESGWTFGSTSSWMEARAQGCQGTNRWSGFWH